MQTIKLPDTQLSDVMVLYPNDSQKRVISFWVKSPNGKTSVMVELRRFQLDALNDILSRAEEVK